MAKTGGKKSANAKELKNIKLVTYWGCKIQIYSVLGCRLSVLKIE
jgi:hypothetical protein